MTKRTEITSRSAPAGGFDPLIEGAGFAGSVLAERLATELHGKVLLVDQRPHIGGNALDVLALGTQMCDRSGESLSRDAA